MMIFQFQRFHVDQKSEITIVNGGVSKGGKVEDTQVKAAKKVTKKKATKKVKALQGDGESPSPELLVDTAIKLLALQNERSEKFEFSRAPLSRRVFDSDFQDALKAAKDFLAMADGKTDDKIHAYQLFREDEAPMPFKAVADRFKGYGWSKMGSTGTVTRKILELVRLAEGDIQAEKEKMEKLADIRMNVPGGVSGIVGRVRRHVRNMIVRTDLEYLFDDGEQVARSTRTIFLSLDGATYSRRLGDIISGRGA